MYVYVIGTPTGAQKIGKTTSPLSRLNNLKTASHEDLEISFLVRTEKAGEVELCAHALLRGHHIAKEWFRVSPVVAKCAVEQAVREVDPNCEPLPAPDLTDPDNPEWTKADFDRARPMREVLPVEALAAFASPPGAVNRRGAQHAPTKQAISIRLSPLAIEHFKSGGPGWQGRIDAVLVEIAKAAKR